MRASTPPGTVDRLERPRTGLSVSVVAAARPNFVKIGPVVRALRPHADVELVHTGQHYDRAMSESFFTELDLPRPDVNLGIGSGSHAEQTGKVMVAYERHLQRHRPDVVVVVGDVNSAAAAALAAVKLHIPVAHVEAGLRSGDRAMPEEINRLLVDRISRWLLTPSEDGDANLLAEGVDPAWIHRVGNVMIDTLLANRPRAVIAGDRARERLGLSGPYALLTLHRPSNVDRPATLRRLIGAVGTVDVPVVFPAHPRTRGRLDGIPLPSNLRVVEPLGYLEFSGLMGDAALVLTDSGGIQEETSVLGIPCLTLRENTERPITCTLGTNRLVGTDARTIATAAASALAAGARPARIPLWDGRAGERIAGAILADVGSEQPIAV